MGEGGEGMGDIRPTLMSSIPVSSPTNADILFEAHLTLDSYNSPSDRTTSPKDSQHNENKTLETMSHDTVFYSRPRTYGKGSRGW